MSRSKILLAEDDPLMRDTICTLLTIDFEVVRAVGRGDEVEAAVMHSSPDAVVLDISLPGRSGLRVLADLRAQQPSLTIIMLTTHTDPSYQREAILRGADGFIQKGNAGHDLAHALRSALTARGAHAMSPHK